MQISDRGVSLIAGFEGCRLTAYRDSVGVLTIGYGHTHGVKTGQSITKGTALRFLRYDLNWVENAINSLRLPLTQNQYDATCSFVFNLGPGLLDPTHDFGRALRGKRWQTAADSMLEYIDPGRPESAGLLRRRKSERALFLENPGRAKVLQWQHQLDALRARAAKGGWTPARRKLGAKLKALITRK